MKGNNYVCCEPGSSVNIVSGYGPDDRGFDPLQRQKDFSSILCVQIGSRAHPASCTVGTGGPFLRAKSRSVRDVDRSHQSSAEVENEQKLHLLSPFVACMACDGTAL
jgi:hypothetical protein